MAILHPISTNFTIRQQYDFEIIQCDEKEFFEWLVIKRLCFGNDTFYYQNDRVIKELGIKKHRLETIKGNFISLGLIVEQKGWCKTTHYTINNDFIKSFLERSLKPENKKYIIREVLKLKFNNTKELTEWEKEEAVELLSKLNDEYNTRRRLYAEEKDNKFQYSYTEIPANETEIKQLLSLRYYVGNDKLILNSFISFIDDIIKGVQDPTSPIALFTKHDKEKGGYPKFDYHLNKFNNGYSIKI